MIHLKNIFSSPGLDPGPRSTMSFNSRSEELHLDSRSTLLVTRNDNGNE